MFKLMISFLGSHFSDSTYILISIIYFAFHIFEKTQTFGVVLIHPSMTKATNLPVSIFKAHSFPSSKPKVLFCFVLSIISKSFTLQHSTKEFVSSVLFPFLSWLINISVLDFSHQHVSYCLVSRAQ